MKINLRKLVKFKRRKMTASEVLIASNRITMIILLMSVFHIVYVVSGIEGPIYWTPMITNGILLLRFTFPWNLLFEKVK
jgi:hypothetical protein